MAGLPVHPEYHVRFAEVLRKTYFTGWPADYLDTEVGRQDLQNHVDGRMTEFASVLLPWVEQVFPLAGRRVLEIGAGTGSSTAAIAARAEHVLAVDVAGPSLEAARARTGLLGLTNVHFRELSPHWLEEPEAQGSLLREATGPVDAVFLVALLEHLTIPERLAVLQLAWAGLRPGGVLVVYETPNRLGWFDWHSFELPFFHLLPDSLAIPYSRRSKRPYFGLSSPENEVEQLYRLGRGVSYHEFELAIGLDQLTVLNDGFAPGLLALRQGLAEPEYDQALLGLIAKHLPDVPAGFARPSLELVILRGVDAEARARASAHSRMREIQRIAAEAAASPGPAANPVEASVSPRGAEEVPLRYRLADRLNSVVKRAPLVHPLLKRFLARAGMSGRKGPTG